MDNEEEGARHSTTLLTKKKFSSTFFLFCFVAARQYVSRTKSSLDVDADVSMEPSESRDLGWKLPAGKKKKRKSGFAIETTKASDGESTAERKQLAAVSLI